MNQVGGFRRVLQGIIMLSLIPLTSSVFAQPQRVVFQVYGAIGDKYRQLGANSGPLGAPKSNELDAARGGRYNKFANGFIYWHPNIGAYAVYGVIGEKWSRLGREAGFGYPLTDETPAAGGGRFNDFENSKSIYWHPRTGAHAIYGAIRDKWVSMGRELSKHGYPKTHEYAEAGSNSRRVDFECGHITWSKSTGVRSVLCVRLAEPQLIPSQ